MRSLLIMRFVSFMVLVWLLGLHTPAAYALIPSISRDFQDSTTQQQDFASAVASLPEEFTLSGTKLLLVGTTERPHQEMEVALWRTAENVVIDRVLLTSDAQAAFAEIWDLQHLCDNSSAKNEYVMTLDGLPRHHMQVDCSAERHTASFDQMRFAGEEIAPLGRTQTLLIKEGEDAIFEAIGQPWMQVYAVYASIITSRDIYAGNQGKIRIAPWQFLSSGAHHLYIAPYDPIRKVLYDPVVIPFEVQGGAGEQLKATVYYAPGAAAIVLLVFLGSILYIRRTRSLRRGIVLVGEEYPDEFLS